MKKFEISNDCSKVNDVFDLLGKKWVVPILLYFWKNPKEKFNFSYFSKVFPSITSRVISMRLKELEYFGIVDRINSGTKMVYVLTADGLKLFKVFKSVENWTQNCENLTCSNNCLNCSK